MQGLALVGQIAVPVEIACAIPKPRSCFLRKPSKFHDFCLFGETHIRLRCLPASPLRRRRTHFAPMAASSASGIRFPQLNLEKKSEVEIKMWVWHCLMLIVSVLVSTLCSLEFELLSFDGLFKIGTKGDLGFCPTLGAPIFQLL